MSQEPRPQDATTAGDPFQQSHPHHAAATPEPPTSDGIWRDGAQAPHPRHGLDDGHTSLEHLLGPAPTTTPGGPGGADGDPSPTRNPAPASAASTTSALQSSKLLFRARGLEMAGRESMVFGPVDFDLARGHIGVVTGQQGAGRSALLLALAGRLKGVQGSLQVGEIDGVHHARALRKQVAVARITDFADLEPNLTVGESRDERAIAEGIGQREGRRRFAELEDLLGHRFELDQWTDRMPAVERTLLTLVLGCLAPSRYVVVDDLDEQLTDEQLRWIHDGMALLVAQHHNFVVSALDQSPLPEGATVLHLPAPPPRVEPALVLRKPSRRQTTTREDA